ncbi:hypothetical protein PR048_028998 [Dryococelus australis]|uniref:THAP9-like helix-turn-helix domain-containing protein n=1 Tax=Dryococelus australis TaxID=614101 RepID=A0ABQ9GCQ8_9NEOP|nr:hypothetical protein PR048_028998 [Dryococelus australis]
MTSNEFPDRSERLKNRTVKGKLVSDLKEMRKRKRHPENSKCKENKTNGTHVVTQKLNERTMCQPGPSQHMSVIQRIHFLESEMKLFQMRVSSLEEEIKQELINNKIQHRQCPKYANTKLREIFKRHRKADFQKQKANMVEDDDIAAAVTLRSISKKTYLYLRKNVGLPLPGLSTIRKWTRNLSVYLASKKNYFQDRLTVLSFDAMRVDSRMCYDQREARIMGRHSIAQAEIYVCGKTYKFLQSFVYESGGRDAKSVVNKWFEVMNSRFVKDFRKPWHSAFGIHFIEQAQILETIKGIVENTSVIGKTPLMPFQKGTVVSIKSLTGPYNYLVSTENLKYVIIGCLIQDVLETLFFSGT